MPKEEFKIRVTKKGEVFVEMEGLPPRRVKDLVQFMEETLGPAHQLVEDESGDATGGVEIDEELGREEEDEEQESPDRLPLRDDEEG